MLDRAIAGMVGRQVAKGRIKDEDRDVYAYGYRVLAEKAVAFVLTVAIAVLLRAVPYVLLFYLVFVPLRVFAGGYHADRAISCLFLSGGMLILYVLLLKGVEAVSCGAYLCVSELALVPAIWKLAPVQHKNKPLSEGEQRHYGKVCRILLAVQLVGALLAVIFGRGTVAAGIAAAHMAVLVLLLLGKKK